MSKEAMSSKKYHHGDLKNALIQAGVEIINKQGANYLTLRSVAKHSQVSQTALYRHFNCKEDLLAAIAEKGFYKIHLGIRLAIEQNPDDPIAAFRASCRSYLNFAISEQEYYRVMLTMSGGLDKEKYPERHAIGMETFYQMEAVIKLCQAKGTMRTGNSQDMTISAWSALHGLTMLLLDGQFRFLDKTPELIAQLSESLIDTIVRGLR